MQSFEPLGSAEQYTNTASGLQVDIDGLDMDEAFDIRKGGVTVNCELSPQFATIRATVYLKQMEPKKVTMPCSMRHAIARSTACNLPEYSMPTRVRRAVWCMAPAEGNPLRARRMWGLPRICRA